MPKLFKYIGYFALFVFSYFIFLYWTFPYGILKERLVGVVEQQLGGDYDVRIGELSPSFFTGAVLKQVKVLKHEGSEVKTVWEAQKVKVRASLFSLIVGKTSVTFSVKTKGSSVSGSFSMNEDGFNFTGDLSNFNLGDIGDFKGKGGVNLSSALDGPIELNINRRQVIQSSGNVELSLADIKSSAGDLELQNWRTLKLPDLVYSKGSGSNLKIEISKGQIHIKEFKLADGDLILDLNGDIFMAPIFENYRMNLKGNFSVTPRLEETIKDELYFVRGQKQADGTYPLTITGRIGQWRRSIKIGDFTLPL